MKSLLRHIEKRGVLFLGTTLLTIVLLNVSISTNVVAADKGPAKETKEAIAAIGDYTVEQKDKAVDKAKEMMDEIDDRMHVLEGKMEAGWDDMQQSTKDKYNSTMKSLRKQRNDLAEWYGSMKHSSKDAWQEVKNGFSKSYDTLVQSWQTAEDEMEKEK